MLGRDAVCASHRIPIRRAFHAPFDTQVIFAVGQGTKLRAIEGPKCLREIMAGFSTRGFGIYNWCNISCAIGASRAYTEWFAKSKRCIYRVVRKKQQTTNIYLMINDRTPAQSSVGAKKSLCCQLPSPVMRTGTVFLTLLLIAHGCSQASCARWEYDPDGRGITRKNSTDIDKMPRNTDRHIYIRDTPPPLPAVDERMRKDEYYEYYVLLLAAAAVHYTTTCMHEVCL